MLVVSLNLLVSMIPVLLCLFLLGIVRRMLFFRFHQSMRLAFHRMLRLYCWMMIFGCLVLFVVCLFVLLSGCCLVVLFVVRFRVSLSVVLLSRLIIDGVIISIPSSAAITITIISMLFVLNYFSPFFVYAFYFTRLLLLYFSF